MKEFRDITYQSQHLYEDLIGQQETSINDLKKDLASSSFKDSYENILLLNEQTERRLQSKIVYHTGFVLVSASVISLVISYFLHR